jgi:hypothetical protein
MKEIRRHYREHENQTNLLKERNVDSGMALLTRFRNQIQSTLLEQSNDTHVNDHIVARQEDQRAA